jgi:hypothetical protein
MITLCTQKLYEIYVFNSVQCNSKKLLYTSVLFNVGPCVRSTYMYRIFKHLPRVYQNVTCYKLEYHLDICRATTGAHIEVYGRA